MQKPSINHSFQYPGSIGEMPSGPCADAGVLVEANAGWRVFRPVLDAAKCVKCLKCWLICPDGAIDRSGKDYAIDYAFCKGCGICAYECPTKSIRMEKEGDDVE
ncbi:MAG TPA: 4Fe-4S binding protein [Selenomonadales bacterium]|nr:4Fe-4S binding protein [Selenomonadales bacterium]